MTAQEALEQFDRPIAFHRAFVSVEYEPGKRCGIAAAVLLSQAIYWQRRQTKPYKQPQKLQGSGWWWKTEDSWEDETGLTPREQSTARKRLEKAGLLEVVRAGNPAKLWYRVNIEALGSQFCASRRTSSAQSAEQVPTNPQNTLDETKDETSDETSPPAAVLREGSGIPPTVKGPPEAPPRPATPPWLDDDERRRRGLSTNPSEVLPEEKNLRRLAR